MTDQILRIRDVRAVVPLSRSTIYKLAAEGQFPPPIKLGAKASGWRASEVEAWIADRKPGREIAR